MDYKAQLLDKLGTKQGVVGIIGLGYVGLPLGMEFAKAGFRVLGFDVDERKVARLNASDSYVSDVPSADLAEVVQTGRLQATADFDRLAEADALCICVPTPLTITRDPDMSYVIATAEAVAKRLRPGQLIVLESTTYPGTTREEVLPRLAATGLKVGEDFFCGFSPERVNPGSLNPPFAKIPKVVSGITDHCREVTQTLYGVIMERTVPVSSPEVAEMTKLLENIFRAVNISLVNELKMIGFRMGIDIWEVIEAAATKPYGYMPFYPGPGLGGHCIPIDPFYLSWRARAFEANARFVELAGEINGQMPEFVVHRVSEALNSQGKALNGSRVLVLGVAYKAGTNDCRESPAVRILDLLKAAGAEVRYHDPFVPELPRIRHSAQQQLSCVALTEAEVSGASCVLIVTDHGECDYQWVVDHASLVVDTRNVTRNLTSGKEKVWLA